MGMGTDEQQRLRIAAVRAGRYPSCGGPLTDPARSPGRYSHCFTCRVGWRIDPHSLRGEDLVNRPHPWKAPITMQRSTPIRPMVRDRVRPPGSQPYDPNSERSQED